MHGISWHDSRVVKMQSHGVTDKVLRTRFQAKLLVDIRHGVLVEVDSWNLNLSSSHQVSGTMRHTLMSRRVIVLPVLQKLEEAPRPSFLEQPHQATRQGLPFIRGHLCDSPVPQHVGAGDLLEFEVSGDVGLDEHLSELAGCQDEFGDQVDGVVSVPAEALGRRRVAELVVKLKRGQRLRNHVGPCIIPESGSNWQKRHHSSLPCPCAGPSCPRRTAVRRAYIHSSRCPVSRRDCG